MNFLSLRRGTITGGLKEHIEEGLARVFVDVTEPIRLYVLKSGFKGRYTVVEEDPYDKPVCVGVSTKEDVELRYNIKL